MKVDGQFKTLALTSTPTLILTHTLILTVVV